MLVRNLAGVQGLSMKAGRQYVIFGNHSLFGHFDWANTGYSHDGVMFAYQTKSFDSYFGWFRNSESDIAQAAAVGSGGPNIAGGTATPSGAINATAGDANRDADMFIFYNQIKMVPGMVIEPFYVYYKNNYCSADNAGQGLGTAKHSNQTRHMIGNRIEMRKGGFDFSNEIAWQFGQMGQAGACTGEQKCLHINAWATRNWIGYTMYETRVEAAPGIQFRLCLGRQPEQYLRECCAPVRRPIPLKTSSRQTTSTWDTWTSRPGRTCCPRQSIFKRVQLCGTISSSGTPT